MLKNLSTPAAILLGVGAIGLLWAAFPRTMTTATPYGYIERDRWTGHMIACSVAEPGTFLKRELTIAESGKTLLPVAMGDTPGTYRYTSSERDPPRICLDLD